MTRDMHRDSTVTHPRSHRVGLDPSRGGTRGTHCSKLDPACYFRSTAALAVQHRLDIAGVDIATAISPSPPVSLQAYKPDGRPHHAPLVV
jgi:hypothetical protein